MKLSPFWTCQVIAGLLLGSAASSQLAVAAGNALAKAPFVLTRDGKSLARIVVAKDACRIIRAAAEELQLHIEQATGARLPVVKDDQLDGERAPLILIGESRATKALGYDLARFKFEEFAVYIAASRIVLIGRDDPKAVPFGAHREFHGETGTLLAVYSFLKEFLGVRWYYPGDLGTVMPKTPTVMLEPCDRKLQPRFSPRETVLRCGSGLEVTAADFAKWARRTRHGGMLMSLGHSFGSVVGPDFVKTHPDYFAVDEKGKRAFHNVSTPMLVHLCLSQPDLVDVFVKAGKKYYDSSPSRRCFTVMPGDAFRTHCCKCAKCLAQYDYDKPDIPDLMQESRYVWGFANKVAGRLRQEYPDRLVLCCAYSKYRLPYKDMKYEPNIAVAVTVNRVGFGYQPNDAVNGAQVWKGVVNHILVDENYHHGVVGPAKEGGLYVWDGAPRLCPRRIAAEIKKRAEFIEAQPYDVAIPREEINGKPASIYRMWMMDNLNLYVSAELDFDPAQDVETIIDQYCRDLYGPAAAEVKSFFDILERRWTETPARLGVRTYMDYVKLRDRMLKTAWTEIYPPDVIKELFAILARAQGKTGRSIYGERVALLKRSFQYMKERSDAYFRTKAQGVAP